MYTTSLQQEQFFSSKGRSSTFSVVVKAKSYVTTKINQPSSLTPSLSPVEQFVRMGYRYPITLQTASMRASHSKSDMQVMRYPLTSSDITCTKTHYYPHSTTNKVQPISIVNITTKTSGRVGSRNGRLPRPGLRATMVLTMDRQTTFYTKSQNSDGGARPDSLSRCDWTYILRMRFCADIQAFVYILRRRSSTTTSKEHGNRQASKQ